MTAEYAAYLLYSADSERDLYAVEELQGFFESEEYATFRAPRARRLAEPPVQVHHDVLELRVLGKNGLPVAAYTVGSAEISEEHERGNVVDLRVSGYLWDTPCPGTDAVWSAWRTSSGDERNIWAGLPEEGREAWLDAARLRAVWRFPIPPPPSPSDSFRLDGSHVTDHSGLYCALGEALNGPGGYYGSTLDALKDCLRGNFGPVAPFTLVWHDSATARTHIPEYMDEVVRTLRSAGVTTLLT